MARMPKIKSSKPAKTAKLVLALCALGAMLLATFKGFDNTCKTQSSLLKSMEGNNHLGERRSEKNTSPTSAITDNNLLLKSSDSADYMWMGNHWIPPPGVPTYTPLQMLEYFSKRNVLFIGDSTARRSFGTLHGLMNATDKTNVDVLSIDAASVIDWGKHDVGNDPKCNEPGSGRVLELPYTQCFDLPNDAASIVSTNTTIKKRANKFDMAFFPCYRYAIWRLSHNEKEVDFLSKLKASYDLIIIGMGIWEVAQVPICAAKGLEHTSVVDRLTMVLNTIQNTSSPDLQIVFRTPGFDGAKHYEGLWEIIRASKAFFANLTDRSNAAAEQASWGGTSSNISLVDWGSAIAKRSHDENRIAGDNSNHYGLEARLLFIQQLMHELAKAELQ